jgi:glycosyltransferase involved in cell wall biosynthesis
MPRLAVNMMVLNGAKVLRRCLLPLVGVIDELVVIDCGSEDETRQVLEELASELHL